MKYIYTSLLAFMSLSFCHAQYVNFNDYNFEQMVIAMGVDTNFNNVIELSEAEAVTELYLDCSNCTEDQKINSLGGIESFINLTQLDCSFNSISNLDLTANSNLTWLTCTNNYISSLIISSNSNLQYLNCGSNFMSNLNVNGCINLTNLLVHENNLNDLDVSTNTSLDYFDCSYNDLTTLNVSANGVLGSLRCHHMPNLTSMNLKNGAGNTYYIIDSNPNLMSICIDDFGLEPDRIQYAIDNYDYPDCEIITDCDTLNTAEFYLEHEINFYPNPTSAFLKINSQYDIYMIEIFDLRGNSVEVISSSIAKYNYELSLQNFSSGIYLFKLSTTKGVSYKKIIKK